MHLPNMKTCNIQVFIDRKYLVSCHKLYVLLMNCESIGELEHRQLKKDCHLAKGLKLKSELNLAYDFS